MEEGGSPGKPPRPGGRPAAAAAAAAAAPGGAPPGMPGGSPGMAPAAPGMPGIPPAAACCMTTLSSCMVICLARSTATATDCWWSVERKGVTCRIMASSLLQISVCLCISTFRP